MLPAGAKVAGTGFEPSASLVRAVLLGGAASMTGYSVATAQRLQPAPNNFQGFGRVDLSRSIPLKGNSLGWKLQVIDKAVFLNTKTNHTYSVKTTGEGPLVITLAWLDWTSFPGSLPPYLINDLDLIVTGPNGTASGSPPGIWRGNGIKGGDGLNNIERVTIATPAAGTYNITIVPYYLFVVARPQLYALALQGGISGTIASAYNPAYVLAQNAKPSSTKGTGTGTSGQSGKKQSGSAVNRTMSLHELSATSGAVHVRRRHT